MQSTTTPVQPGQAILEYSSNAVILPRGELVLGRGLECSFRVDDPNVSRRHLRLLVGETVILAEDLGSTNGTFINGEPLTGIRPLRDGDEITLGSRTLRLRLAGGAATFDCDERTPVAAQRRRGELSTLRGIGAVSEAQLEQTCPRCGPVPFNANGCPSCGVRWPRGRHKAPTHSVNEAVETLRRNERYAVKVSVQYISQSLKVNGVAANLSETGVFIATRQVDPVGTRCRLVFFSPDGGRSSQEGFVRRVIHKGVKGSAGMGIEFGQVGPG